MTLYCHPDVLDGIRPAPEGTPTYIDAGYESIEYCKCCGALKTEHTEDDPSA